METTLVIGLEVEFIALNEGIFPVPLAAKPIAEFEFVQLNVAVFGLAVTFVSATAFPAHTVIFEGATMVGSGLTITLPLLVLVHPAEEVAVNETKYVPGEG